MEPDASGSRRRVYAAGPACLPYPLTRECERIARAERRAQAKSLHQIEVLAADTALRRHGRYTLTEQAREWAAPDFRQNMDR